MYLSIGIYVFVYFVFVYFCVFCVCIFVGSTFVKAGPGFRSHVTSTFYLLSHTTQSVTRRILHPLSIVPTCEKNCYLQLTLVTMSCVSAPTVQWTLFTNMTGTLEGWIYNGELWGLMHRMGNCTATKWHESGQSLPNLFGFSIVSFFHKFVSAQTLDVKFQLFCFGFKVPIGNPEERSDKSCKLCQNNAIWDGGSTAKLNVGQMDISQTATMPRALLKSSVKILKYTALMCPYKSHIFIFVRF